MKMMDVKNVLTEEQVKAIAEDTNRSKSARIKELFEHGMEVKDIAAALKIRYNFAYNVIQNYVIVNDIEVQSEKRETKKDQVFALFDEGKTITEVSKELKMNYNYVWKLNNEWKRLAAAEVQAEEAKGN